VTQMFAMHDSKPPPIIANKDHAASAAFTPENLLREARRQKGLAQSTVPDVCVLDPDGDIVRQLRRSGRAHKDLQWACYQIGRASCRERV